MPKAGTGTGSGAREIVPVRRASSLACWIQAVASSSVGRVRVGVVVRPPAVILTRAR